MTSNPDLAEALAPLVERVTPGARPRLVALLERGAAVRYRDWAAAASGAGEAAGLRACAAREEEIARRIEATFASSPDDERQIAGVLPEIARLYDAALAGRPVAEQYAIQAAAERRGAALWRSFAEPPAAAHARDALLACAGLEEENAAFLDALLGTTRGL